MSNTWALSALWLGLALAATLLAIWFKISTALSEIVVGTVAQLVIGAFLAHGGLLGNTQWITFLAGTGAIVLTFLAGAEPRSCHFQDEVARSVGHRTSWLLRPVSRLHFDCALCAALGRHGQLAMRRRALDDLGGRGVCGNAGAWLQRHRVRQVDPGRMLYQRPGNRDRTGNDLLAVHHQDIDLCGGFDRGLRTAPLSYAVVLPQVRRARLRTGSQVHPVSPVRDGWIGGLVRKRGRAACLHDRHGPCGNSGQGPLAHPASANAHLWTADAVLLYPRGIVCLGPGTDRSARHTARSVFGEDANEGCFCLPGGSGAQV